MYFQDEMSFREYIREYHAVLHIMFVTCLSGLAIYTLYKKYPDRMPEIFNFTVPGIVRIFFGGIFCLVVPIFQISKLIFLKGLFPGFFINLLGFFHRPPIPKNFNPEPGSDEWYELQHWVYYQDRWKDLWHSIKEGIKSWFGPTGHDF